MRRLPFIRTITATGPEPVIRGDGLTLRSPTMDDFQHWVALRRESREFLKAWEPTWPADDLSRAAFRRRLKRYQHEGRTDRGYSFFIFRDDGCLLGGLALSNLRRGVSQCASLGYWIGARHAGRGYMTKAVACLLPFAFGTLHLHRIEAACMPENTASRRLLEGSGFSREGFARKYLQIDSVWRDHILYAILVDDFKPVARNGAAMEPAIGLKPKP